MHSRVEKLNVRENSKNGTFYRRRELKPTILHFVAKTINAFEDYLPKRKRQIYLKHRLFFYHKIIICKCLIPDWGKYLREVFHVCCSYLKIYIVKCFFFKFISIQHRCKSILHYSDHTIRDTVLFLCRYIKNK